MISNAVVCVVDDDPAIRKSLRWLIESVGLTVEAFESAREFLDAYDPEKPGCIVLDVRMPGMNGLELQEKLRDMHSQIPIIIVTGYGDVPMAVRAVKSGAVEFLEKPVSDQLLLGHIQQAIEDDLKNRDKLAEQRAIYMRAEQLTRREREVLKLVVEGLSSKEIAAKFSVSLKTIETHRVKIMKKMQARSIPHLIRMSLSLSPR